jgi:aspartyl-tRNA synthetase
MKLAIWRLPGDSILCYKHRLVQGPPEMRMPTTADELLQRTTGCGQLTVQDAEQRREVVLTGWVHRRRDLGQLIFVELRDPTGVIQVLFDPSESAQAHTTAEQLRQEFVVGVRGVVVPRQAVNPRHPTGRVEVRATQLVIHNRADWVPFPVDDEAEPHEEARLKYRYVDLRRPKLQRALRLRHRLAAAARRVLDREGFVEIETPVLTRSTPEGARDYLVPSRLQPGRFYALPQSPQLFKQLLMIAGFDRYYQFPRCFRDEDLRADRQPEFTQIDIEMAFATPQTVYAVVERVIVELFRETGAEVATPFPRMSYDEAIERFGTDRPDLRLGMELRDAGPAALGTGFAAFEPASRPGGAVRGIAIPGAAAAATRNNLGRWTELARRAGARGLVWIRIDGQGTVTSSALRSLGEDRCRDVGRAVGAGPGDLALVVADARAVCNRALGILRVQLAAELDRTGGPPCNVLWIERFPLLEWDEAAGRFFACHHPFTAPQWNELELLETDPAAVHAQAYDLVLNGTEIGGGSIRIHRRDVQERVFRALGIGPEEAAARFGFLLRALESGAPPHGGIALGFDRVCAMLCGAESIRDVIAFPKTTSASDLMTESPSEVDPAQLAELRLRVDVGSEPRSDR